MSSLFGKKKRKKCTTTSLTTTSSLKTNDDTEVSKSSHHYDDDDNDNDHDDTTKQINASSNDSSSNMIDNSSNNVKRYKQILNGNDNEDDEYDSNSNNTDKKLSLYTTSNKGTSVTNTNSNTNNTTKTNTIKSFHDLKLIGGLDESLINICCNILHWKQPTPVQRIMIPYILQQQQSCNQQHSYNQQQSVATSVIAATGSGKTASYIIPIMQLCSIDPIMIHTIIISPTRELVLQIYQQCIVFGTLYNHITTSYIIGGGNMNDIIYQSNLLYNNPTHIIITTPGRFATILTNPYKPRNISKIQYLIIDEADRILPSYLSSSCNNTNTNSSNDDTNTKHNNNTNTNSNCGFLSDMEIIFQHVYPSQQQQQQQNLRKNYHHIPKLFFYSATCTKKNYNIYQNIVSNYINSNMKLHQINISEDVTINEIDYNNETVIETNDTGTNHPDNIKPSPSANTNTNTTMSIITKTNIPNGLKQEYIFIPSKVRDAYVIATIRTLIAYGGTKVKQPKPKQFDKNNNNKKSLNPTNYHYKNNKKDNNNEFDPQIELYKAQSAIIFVSTCERAAFLSELLYQIGIPNVTLHSYIVQSQRNYALQQFKSEHVRIIVATDVASRGLDIPHTDLVLNVELSNSNHHHQRYNNHINNNNMNDTMTYIHRIGRTARAGRRGRAITFVTENDVSIIQNIEINIGTTLQLCTDITDDIALQMLSTTMKASRLAKLKLESMNFYETIQKIKERKIQNKKLKTK